MSPQIKKVKKISSLPNIPNVTIENAKLAFRNFSGKEGRFNAAGQRNFCILLDDDVAKDLSRIGWNVKVLKPRDEGDDPQPYIQVTVSYRVLPPKIVVLTSQNKTILGEETIHVLDWAEIDNVDLIIRPYQWEVNGKTGIKAYVKSMYISLIEDELEKKYVKVPDAAIHNLVSPEDEIY